jgi:hypothetical protein
VIYPFRRFGGNSDIEGYQDRRVETKSLKYPKINERRNNCENISGISGRLEKDEA